MRKNYLLLLLFIFVLSLPIAGKAQQWEWLTSNSIFQNKMVNDDAGNIYFQYLNEKNNSTGIKFIDTAGKIISINNPVKDNIKKGIIKLNTDGRYKWFAEIKNDPSDTSKVDLSNLKLNFIASKIHPGKLIVIGTTRRSLIFDSIKLKPPANFSLNTIFFAECDSNGKWISAKIIGISNITEFSNIAEDKPGNIYISTVLSSYSLFEIFSDTNFQVNPGSSNLWLGKFDSKCNLIWRKNIHTKNKLSIQKPYIAIDNQENVITCFNNSKIEYTGRANKV